MQKLCFYHSLSLKLNIFVRNLAGHTCLTSPIVFFFPLLLAIGVAKKAEEPKRFPDSDDGPWACTDEATVHGLSAPHSWWEVRKCHSNYSGLKKPHTPDTSRLIEYIWDWYYSCSHRGSCSVYLQLTEGISS